MSKKLLALVLLLALIYPIPVQASFYDDVKQLEQKYPDIYHQMDPALTLKMEVFLQDVVEYVVLNYNASKDMNIQIKNGVASTLLTGDKYKNDLLPYLSEQSKNKEQYRFQLKEMQDIVRKEVESRLKNMPAAPPPVEDTSFIDLAGHWASQDILRMISLGLVSGVGDGLFAPDRNITRAEFTALLLNALKIEPVVILRGRFRDVSVDKWYFLVVNTAAEVGLVSGISNNDFGPEQFITREQMAVMISRALSYKEKSDLPNIEAVNAVLAGIVDHKAISPWAREGVATVFQRGIARGRGNGYFVPDARATRAEAAIMTLKMYEQL